MALVVATAALLALAAVATHQHPVAPPPPASARGTESRPDGHTRAAPHVRATLPPRGTPRHLSHPSLYI